MENDSPQQHAPPPSPEVKPPLADAPAPAKKKVKQSAAASPSTFIMPRNPRRPGPVKRRIMLISALLVIGLPTLAAGIYYAFFASDQYAASGHFVVRHRSENTAAMGTLSLLGLGAAPSSSLPDMMVVNDYIVSMQMIKDLAPRIDLRALYDTPQADQLARLKPGLREETISDETLLKYWQKMAVVHYDSTTGLSQFEVRAFSADDAKAIADQVFTLSESLVNRLTERAQQDALSLARQEVETYRERAIASLDALQAFQERAQQVDPEAFAQARAQIQAGVEQELTQLQTQLDVLRANLPEDAPGITQVKDRLSSMEKQLATERIRSTVSETGESAAQILNEFAKLRLESEFATQAYMSSLASLESARIEATRQNLYLETFVRPHTPQVPEYPKSVLNVLLVLVVSALVWAIGGLMVSATREHI
jgi:capsular polysaccharide transport system permease protein